MVGLTRQHVQIRLVLMWWSFRSRLRLRMFAALLVVNGYRMNPCWRYGFRSCRVHLSGVGSCGSLLPCLPVICSRSGCGARVGSTDHAAMLPENCAKWIPSGYAAQPHVRREWVFKPNIWY